MSDVVIKITGPGLVVNGPALTVLKALKEMGFIVKSDSWLGLSQWEPISETGNFIKDTARKINVDVTVDPQPWGG